MKEYKETAFSQISGTTGSTFQTAGLKKKPFKFSPQNSIRKKKDEASYSTPQPSGAMSIGQANRINNVIQAEKDSLMHSSDNLEIVNSNNNSPPRDNSPPLLLAN